MVYPRENSDHHFGYLYTKMFDDITNTDERTIGPMFNIFKK